MPDINSYWVLEFNCDPRQSLKAEIYLKIFIVVVDTFPIKQTMNWRGMW